jgi:nicotinamide-nucleotide amidase
MTDLSAPSAAANSFPPKVQTLAAEVLDGCRRRGWRLATSESCTGGLVAAALTEVAGSSAVFDRGYVTYSNDAKAALLGVPEHLLASYGAVSPQVAAAMAQGALSRADADLTVAITGIAGPGGGSADKPVGLVYFATAVQGGDIHGHVEQFGDLGRSAVRQAALETALTLLRARLT